MVKKTHIAVGLGIAAFLVYKNTSKSIAKSYTYIREVGTNAGFSSKIFEEEIKRIAGWQPGHQWCVYFAKLVWLKKLTGKRQELAKKLISPNSQITWSNFKKDTSGLFTIRKAPKVGDIVIWQRYSGSSPTSSGHAGIVTKVLANGFQAAEGNTNKAGSSDGQGVYILERKYDWKKTSGLRLKGFISYK